MTHKKSLTIEVDVNDITLPIDFYKVNIGTVMSKYDFSIVDKSNDEKLSMIVQEFMCNSNILIGFAVYNLKDILRINELLKTFNFSLDTVFIPSSERIEQRILVGKENARLHGRWIGSSEEEVENNFKNFKAMLQEIKDGMSNTSIIVKEV